MEKEVLTDEVRVDLGPISRINDHRFAFDVDLVIEDQVYRVRNCQLLGPSLSGSWRIYGPSRAFNGVWSEEIEFPFGVRIAIRDAAVRAVTAARGEEAS